MRLYKERCFECFFCEKFNKCFVMNKVRDCFVIDSSISNDKKIIMYLNHKHLKKEY